MRYLFFMLLLAQVDAVAQGFSQINQTPLLYHGSFAGATGGGRLAWVSNVTSYKTTPQTYRSFNSYLSYDNLWKGLGYGISFLNNTAKGTDPFVSYYGPDRYLPKSSYAGNLHLSTKHVFFHSNTGETKYTLSPSLSLGYTQSHSQVENRGSTNPPYITTHKTAHITIGVLLNTRYGYFGVSYKNAYQTAIQNYAVYPTYGPWSMQVVYEESKTTTLIPTFSFVFAQTLSSREKNSLFSLTPSGYISFVSYYKRPENYSGKTISSGAYCFNLTATIWKIYFGMGTTNTIDTKYNLFGGFKNDRFRTGIGYGWGALPAPQGFYELSFSYFFKPHIERNLSK